MAITQSLPTPLPTVPGHHQSVFGTCGFGLFRIVHILSQSLKSKTQRVGPQPLFPAVWNWGPLLGLPVWASSSEKWA